MQYHIFFDTNTLLSFYKKLKPQVIKDIQKHTEYNNIIPVLTNQVIDEFWRNRSKVLNELFLKSEVNSQVRANLKVYENCFVEDINTFADLKLKEKEFNTLHNKFIKDFEKNKNDHNFTADKLINNIF